MEERDVRCSAACTKAAILALAFAAIAFSLHRPLHSLRALNALLGYSGARVNLTEDLTHLKADAAWKYLLASPDGEKAQTTWTLGQLLEYKYEDYGGETPPAATQDFAQKADTPTTPSANPAPATPGGLRVSLTRKIEPLHRIADTLTDLGNWERLTLARTFSPIYDRSILRWAILMHRIVRDNPSWTRCAEPQNPPPQIKGFVPNYCREEFLNGLSLPQIQQLADFETPRLEDMASLLKEQNSIVIPSIGFPVALSSATFLVEIGILLSCLYFWLFFREARTSGAYPGQATLFSVFARTKTSRLLFHVLVVMPAVAAGSLAMKSYWFTTVNVVPAALTVLTIIAVERNISWQPLPKG